MHVAVWLKINGVLSEVQGQKSKPINMVSNFKIHECIGCSRQNHGPLKMSTSWLPVNTLWKDFADTTKDMDLDVWRWSWIIGWAQSSHPSP